MRFCREHILTVGCWLAVGTCVASAAGRQYVLFNRMPGPAWKQARPQSFTPEGFEEVKRAVGDDGSGMIRVGVAFIFSPLASEPTTVVRSLEAFLGCAERTDTPVVVQLDLENWWGHRSDLWNWWDPNAPGYDLANRYNVEWTDWSPENAVRICWRNWGRQIRVLPQPNLMSERYLAACRQEVRRLVPVVLRWHEGLPPEKKGLLVGIKVGHETSIGVNAWHYPGGNVLLGKPALQDRTTGLDGERVPDRGVAQMGYAAVRTAGIRSSGRITEADIVEVCKRYLEVLCEEAATCGVKREMLFTHGAGWRDGEMLYDAAVNRYSCPGWSFYRHAGDPKADSGVQRNLARMDAPYWAAAEWLYQGPRQTDAWEKALHNTLGDSRCRYVCIYNWEGVRDSQEIIAAVRRVIGAGDNR